MDPFNLKINGWKFNYNIEYQAPQLYLYDDTVIYYPWPIISAIIESLIGTNFS